MSEATGRRGTETRQRRRHIDVRCDDAEHAAFTAAAARAGMSVGAFLRHQAIGTPGPRAVRRPQVDRAELARVLAALGRYGSNVNQIARAANSGEIEELSGYLAEITAMQAATLEMRTC